MKKSLTKAGGFLAAYLVFTLVVRFVNVGTIGPEGTSVGLSGLNNAVFQRLGGFHQSLYTVSKLLGYLILLAALCIALLAVLQFVRGRALSAVDYDLKVFVLYGIVVLVVYLITSKFSINYRPVILSVEEGLELSYPSSHTLLAVAVAGAFALQLRLRVKDAGLRRILILVTRAVAALAILARLLAGVHWFTDIIGGVLLGMVLVEGYYAAVLLKYRRNFFFSVP